MNRSPVQAGLTFPGFPTGSFREPNHWLTWEPSRSDTEGTNPDPHWRPDPWDSMDSFLDRASGRYVVLFASYDLARWSWESSKFLTDRSSGFPLMILADFDAPGDVQGDSDPFRLGNMESRMSVPRYHDSIQKIKQAIERGEVYQVNFSRRYEADCRGSLYDFYRRLPPSLTPPMTGYFRFRNREILSLSPERFLAVDGTTVRTEPIKGTRPRSSDPERDWKNSRDLLNSPKDRAEHSMIVDLERNDLNRVCEPGSVRVPRFQQLISLPTVHHMVSTIKGELTSNTTLGDLFRATFPGGSITGAPKSTAVKLIDSLEQFPRGPYTGTLGIYDRKTDRFDSNLLIRTLVREGTTAWWNAGGGVVYDSISDNEDEECNDKVRILRVLRKKLTLQTPGLSPESTFTGV